MVIYKYLLKGKMKKSNLILNLVLKEEIPPRLETVSDSQIRIKLHRVATHEAFSGEVKYKCTLVINF